MPSSVPTSSRTKVETYSKSYVGGETTPTLGSLRAEPHSPLDLNLLSRLEFYRLESFRSLWCSRGGRRCRFRHAHPGATRGLCSLLGDLPPPPFLPAPEHPPFRTGSAYLFGIFKRPLLSQDGVPRA